MDQLSEFYKRIQVYLMKKNQECELRSIVTNATIESKNHIEDICKTVANIFESCDIPIGEKTVTHCKKGVQSYKFLLLNTNFENLNRLAEDIVNGHLVDICPLLSPYLFIQILWFIKYEKILVESLAYMPFDVCIEILQLITKHIDRLEFKRLAEISFRLIFIVYTKFNELEKPGIQSTNVEISINNLLLGFQEYCLLLKEQELFCITEDSLKCKTTGIMLKRFFSTLRKLLEVKDNETLVSNDLEKLYRLTFGEEPFTKCEVASIERVTCTLKQELLSLLRSQVQLISFTTFLGWAEIIDNENVTISLQASIGIECYYLLELMSNDKEMSQDTQLLNVLQDLIHKPEKNSGLSLELLCCAIKNGEKKLESELLYRYKEWDTSTLIFIYDNKLKFCGKDCLILVEYVSTLKKSMERKDIEHNYNLVMQILAYQNMKDLGECVLKYMLKSNGEILDPSCTEEMFRHFISRNADLKIEKNFRTVLLFILKNCKMVFLVLTKIIIAHPDYKSIAICLNDLLLLSSFMQLEDYYERSYYLSILGIICRENVEWSASQFLAYIKFLINHSVIEWHKLVNHVFIPYLLDDTKFNASNMGSILNCIRLFCNRGNEIDITDFMVALLRRMSSIRKNTNISKRTTAEIVDQIKRSLFLYMKYVGKNTDSIKNNIISKTRSYIEPIDKAFVLFLWNLEHRDETTSIIEDYVRNFYCVHNELKNTKTLEKIQNWIEKELLTEDYLRHLIVRAVGKEYEIFAYNLIILDWWYFGWKNEMDAYHQFIRLTIEACIMCLEYPSVGEDDLFPYLFDSLCRVSINFARLKHVDYQQMTRSLLENIRKLNLSVHNHRYGFLINICLCYMSDFEDPTDSSQACKVLKLLLATISWFSNQFYTPFGHFEEPPEIHHNSKIARRFYINYRIISAFMETPVVAFFKCNRIIDQFSYSLNN